MARVRTTRPKAKSKPANPLRQRPAKGAPARKAATVSAGTRKGASGKHSQWVYAFGGGKAEGKAEMRNLLGGKGAGLAEMAGLGLPVPHDLLVEGLNRRSR